jgi:hypothetical protein
MANITGINFLTGAYLAFLIRGNLNPSKDILDADVITSMPAMK